jgi:hypothetical protein
LTISNESVVSATAYASIISSLADDYSNLSPGRSLAVAGVEEGSIITYLADLANSGLSGLAAAGNAAESIRKLFDAIQQAGADFRSGKTSARPNRFEAGMVPFINMATTAAAAGGSCSVKVDYGGDKAEFTVHSAEALKLIADERLPVLPSSRVAATRPSLIASRLPPPRPKHRRK